MSDIRILKAKERNQSKTVAAHLQVGWTELLPRIPPVLAALSQNKKKRPSAHGLKFPDTVDFPNTPFSTNSII